MTSPYWRRWLRSVFETARARPAPGRGFRRRVLRLEPVEDRTVPSGTPTLIADINPGSPGSFSSDTEPVVVGSTSYFFANDGVHGVALWKSDGTTAGTALVKAFDYPYSWEAPDDLVNFNGTVFFTADDGVHGRELWKSDGTTAGTVLVKDVRPGSVSGVPNFPYFEVAGGALYFTGNDGVHGAELWKTDGTTAGTVMVKDINPGIGSNYQRESASVNGTLFFTADDGVHGKELWKSDGTAAGTVLVTDLYPGVGSSNLRNLTNVNGTLFFSALDGTPELKLWKTDGTAAGTVIVKDQLNDQAGFTVVNGTLFFAASDWAHGTELWKSDGTAAGTVLVADVNPGSAPSNPFHLTDVDGTLFFVADDGEHGAELWKSDGTTAGTTLVKDIYPGGSWQYYGGYYTYPGGYVPPWSVYVMNSSDTNLLTNVNGTLYFEAQDGTHGFELWTSDGTTDGTVLVGDIKSGTPGSYPNNLTNLNGELLFSADEGTHGQELWALADDATQGTSLGVSGFPATVTAGVAGTFTVTATNPDGTVDLEYRGTVHFVSSDRQAALPAAYTFTAADQGVRTFTATLKTAGSQSITAFDTTIPGSAGSESGIAVTPAAAGRFTVAGFPSPVTAGTAGTFAVTAWDAYGNVAAGYTGTVHFGSSDPRAVLPGGYTFTAADAGTHTFSATLKTAGIRSLTAADAANPALTGAQSVTVTAAAASRLLVSAPASVNAGALFSLTVTVVDAYGNVVTGYRGTIAFRSSDRTARLPKTYTFTAADQGMHTFTGLVLKKKGSQTITVTDTRTGSLTTSLTIDVR